MGLYQFLEEDSDKLRGLNFTALAVQSTNTAFRYPSVKVLLKEPPSRKRDA
jgi:hypothetical protein